MVGNHNVTMPTKKKDHNRSRIKYLWVSDFDMMFDSLMKGLSPSERTQLDLDPVGSLIAKRIARDASDHADRMQMKRRTRMLAARARKLKRTTGA